MSEAELDPRVQWIVTELRQPVSLDSDAKARLLHRLAAEPRHEPRHRLPWRWAVRPRPVALSPIIGAALAAGLVGIGVLAGRLLGRDAADPSVQVASTSRLDSADGAIVREAANRLPVPSGREVKFVLVAPQAAQVTVVGDFNGWNAAATPMQRDGGTWSIALPLQPGRHLYAFVVNGTHWMPDPAAPLAPEDGFGVSNSVVLVGGSHT